MVEAIQLLNSTGLMLDICGAWLVFVYVFKKPEPLPEDHLLQRSEGMPILHEYKDLRKIDGVSLEDQYKYINKFNVYKEELFNIRATFGFGLLVLGFVIQIVCSLLPNMEIVTIDSIVFALVFGFSSGLVFTHVCLQAVPEPPASKFKKWAKKIDRYTGRLENSRKLAKFLMFTNSPYDSEFESESVVFSMALNFMLFSFLVWLIWLLRML